MRFRLKSLLTACLLGQAVLLFADFKVPALTGAVVDNAGMLSDSGRQQMDATLRKLWNDGGSQYAVLTVTDLGGEAIEAASIKVSDAWKLGEKKKDNGVLILLSKNDRKVRIEVGQGLEGELTDAFASRVIRETIVPELRLGDADAALSGALSRLIHKSDPNFGGTPVAPERNGEAGIFARGALLLLLIFIFVVIKIISSSLGGPRRRGPGGFMGGGWGGGSGGGFGGGGGFSGGGGGFSGGGSSGSW